MKQLNTGELEFDSFDESSRYFAKLLSEGNAVQSKNSVNQGTYKSEIVELENVSYSIPGGRVLSTNPHHSPTMFWAVSEGLSELLNLPRPIMERYLPAKMDESYKITPDRMPCYSYGMRWKEFDQINNLFNRLNDNPTTKRAFLSIYNGLDTVPGRPDASCTIGHHFTIRDGELDVAAHLRSWDFFAGNIYDTFLAGLLQKSFASWLRNGNHPDLKLGRLHFYANSLHYYPERSQTTLEEMLKQDAADFYDDVLPAEFCVDQKTFFKDMYHLSDSELASYNGNFEYAIVKMLKIQDPLIRDFTRVFLRKNLKRDSKSAIFNGHTTFETTEMKKWNEVRRNSNI